MYDNFKGFGKFFSPLIFFVIGMVLLALSLIFYPAIGNAASSLQFQTSGVASHYWGWSWVVGGTRLWIFLIGLANILVGVAVVWLKRR